MAFLRLILGTVAFIIAIKLVAIILGVIGFALKLIWIAIVLGAIVLVAWVIYKLITPNSTQQA
jgi:hypothetical protein